MTQQAFYSVHPKFHAAVDCIIFGFEEGELSLLLLQRNFEPAKGEWSLAGGFVEDGENIDDAARRVVAELTGLDDLYMRQVHTYGEVERDPGERVLSTAYYALVDIKRYDRELVRAHNAFWIRLPEIPHLIFDHDRMVTDALRFMRYQASVKPVGINLLPEEFTLTQLQNLYEAILGEPGTSASGSPRWTTSRRRGTSTRPSPARARPCTASTGRNTTAISKSNFNNTHTLCSTIFSSRLRT